MKVKARATRWTTLSSAYWCRLCQTFIERGTDHTAVTVELQGNGIIRYIYEEHFCNDCVPEEARIDAGV